MTPSAVALVSSLVLLAGAIVTAVMYGYTPAEKYLRARWEEYRTWVSAELYGMYSPLTMRDFVLRQAALGLGGLLFGGLVMGSWWYGAFLVGFLGYLPILWLSTQRDKRRRALDEQLDSMLQSLANTILVTQNLEDAFATIAEHFDPPISQEADVLVKQVRLGTPMDEALREWAVRCRSRNVDAIVTALTVGRQTGGDLPTVLETTAQVMRETMRVEGMMASKTSEGKAQMVVMAMLPFLFGGALQVIDPEWMYPVFHDPIGWGILLVASVFEFFGVAMARKLSRIDV